MTRFGRFDIGVVGEKGFGFDPVSFTIAADGDSISTYTSALTNKGFLFSASCQKVLQWHLLPPLPYPYLQPHGCLTQA